MRIQNVRQVLKLPGVVLMIVAGADPAWAAPQRDSPAPANRNRGCWEESLDYQPGWTISSSWSDDGSTLLVVDTYRNEVLKYSNRGKFQGTVPRLEQAANGNYTPSTLKSQGSGQYLELSQARMVRLDSNLNPVQRYDLLKGAQRAGESIKGIFQWDLAGNEAVVFGDVHRPGPQEVDQQWRSGFFRMPIDKPAAFRSLYETSPKDPARIFYRLGNPLFASIGKTSYILLMEERPRIYRNRQGQTRLEPLEAFPAGLEERPTLPSWRSLDDFSWLMRVVERSTMPVSLFGWEGHLYVVGRHAEDRGGTRWSLTKIDPQADKVLWTTQVDLPPTAHHVTVAPGPRQWAWIQKGVARGLFNQDIDRVLFMPSEKLRGLPGANACP
jgi:hypothetical protein